MFGSYIDAKVRIYLLHNCFFFFIAIRTLKTLHFGTSELDSSSKIHDPPSLLHAKYKQAQTD